MEKANLSSQANNNHVVTPAVSAAKQLCFLRCLKAVGLGVLMQYVLLLIFLLVVNADPLHPLQWVGNSLGHLVSIRTWFLLLPLVAAIVLHGFMLSKSYLPVQPYYATRFKWALNTAPHKFGFFCTHALVGLLTAWLYVRFLRPDYSSLSYECFIDIECLNKYYTFLIIAGLAAGCYYFVRHNCRHEAIIEFPIIQESKWVKIRTQLFATCCQSLADCFLPTLAYTVTYWVFAPAVNNWLLQSYRLQNDDSMESLFAIVWNARLLFYTWILCSQIMCNMSLMQRLFSVFLAEQMDFSIERSPMRTASCEGITLVDALAMQQIPLMQTLAALDLYKMSMDKSRKKRQKIFALSLPGNHPYNWNHLSGQCLSLIEGFTDELTTSVQHISAMKTTPRYGGVKLSATEAAEKILLRQYNETYGIRCMMQQAPSSMPPQKAAERFSDAAQDCKQQVDQLKNWFGELNKSISTAFNRITVIFYLFGEPDGAKTAFLLSKAQTIVWLCEGLAGICVASLVEDQYGVVQIVLPQIIKALLRLKLELEKLNNVNLNGKKLDRNLITLKNAVKRSLYKIASIFGDYLKELCEDPLDYRHMQEFLSFQES